VFQIVLASAFVYAGHRLHWTDSLTIDTLLTLVWIVGITNALNLLDNMDGLAAGVGIVACVSLLLTVAADVPTPEAQLLATLLGALAAFLVFNAHPASIFMGDTGSLLTGLVLAAASLVPGNSVGPPELLSVVAAPVMVLFIPIFDTTFVVIARILSGRRPVEGGRDHSSHRLVAMGLSEPAAVAVLWVLAAIGGLIGVGVHLVSSALAGVIAGVFVIAMALFAAYLAGVRVYEDGPSVQSRGLTPVVVDFMYKRRVLEVLLDLSLVCVAYYSAYRLRFDSTQFDAAFPHFLHSLPVVIAGQIPVLLALGAYRGMWRHFGLMDAVVFAKSVALGTLASVAMIAGLNNGLPMPGAVFVIYAALLMLLLTGSRASFRLITEFISRRASGRRVVIYASLQDEQLAVHRLATSGSEPRRVLGFFEDSSEGARTSVEGYPILGDYGDLLDLIAAGRTDDVIACVQNIEEGRLDELVEHCSVHNVALVKFHYALESAVTKKFEVLEV
jgi:UDP-GlcNAc:undecaprenyl-phosphate GlcNAc-1-phosphate transferase